MSNFRRILRAIEPHPGEHFKDKIIAVSLAFVVWFFVNSEDPLPQNFQFVPLSIVEPAPELAIASEIPETVSVWVEGSQRDLGRVNPGLLSPQIDLSEARLGDNVFRLDPGSLNPPSGVIVTSIDPEQVTITLEERINKQVPVSVVTAGEPAPGFQVVGRTTDPDSVTISGPRSHIASQERVETATADLRGRRASFSQLITLNTDDPFVELPQSGTVELRIEIAETATSEQFDDVRVEVINSRYQVAVNPQVLGVVLNGPPSVLEQIDVEQLTLIIDAAELQPSAEDYRIEPTVRFDPAELGDQVEVGALYPQRLVDVHVFEQPARR